MDNRATITGDPRDEPIAPVEDTEKASPESIMSYLNTSRSQTNTPQKMTRSQRKEQFRLEQGRNLTDRDLSHIICYKCDKRGHFADKCTEPRDNVVQK